MIQMNKDIKGLLKYLLIMLVIWLMPLGMLYCGLLAYGLSDHYNDYFAIVFLLLGLVLFILYFILPIIFTYKAMKYHWSKYLDIFFYNKWLPIIILVVLICLRFVLSFSAYEWILFFVLPYYCCTYLGIIFTIISNSYKNRNSFHKKL